MDQYKLASALDRIDRERLYLEIGMVSRTRFEGVPIVKLPFYMIPQPLQRDVLRWLLEQACPLPTTTNDPASS